MLAAAVVVDILVDVIALAGDVLLVFAMAITLVGAELLVVVAVAVVVMGLIAVVDFVVVLAMSSDLPRKVFAVVVYLVRFVVV